MWKTPVPSYIHDTVTERLEVEQAARFTVQRYPTWSRGHFGNHWVLSSRTCILKVLPTWSGCHCSCCDFPAPTLGPLNANFNERICSTLSCLFSKHSNDSSKKDKIFTSQKNAFFFFSLGKLEILISYNDILQKMLCWFLRQGLAV